MKINFTGIAIAALIIGINSSCSNHDHQDDQQSQGVTEEANAVNQSEHDEHLQSNQVSLNEGERWEANEATTEGIKSMKGRIAFYYDNSGIQAKDELAESLTADFEAIFKNCTMKGEAHNQLHNFLLPMKEKLETIEGEDEQQSEKAIKELSERLDAYDKYFK